jgi:hypothetical protein
MVSNSSGDWQRQMPHVRGRLDRDTEQLVKNTEQLVKKAKEQIHWRHFVAEHPWLSLAAAAAAGYAIVPRRSCAVTVDWKSIRKAMPPEVPNGPPPREPLLSGLVGNMLSIAAASAFRQVASLVSEQVRRTVSEFVQSRSNPGERKERNWEPSQGDSYGLQSTSQKENGRSL